MILVTGVLIAVFLVPDAWTVPVIGGAVLLEVVETFVSLKIARRFGRPKVGPEQLIGRTGRVTVPCHPLGQVRVAGEVWQARCGAGADTDARVRVVARDGLVLTVEPVAE